MFQASSREWQIWLSKLCHLETDTRDVAEKVSEWLEAGARMVIVVNPRNRTVQVHTSEANRTY